MGYGYKDVIYRADFQAIANTIDDYDHDLGGAGDAESEALQSVLRELVESIEALHGQLQGVDAASYNHVPLKTAFSVKARFKLTGKMLPRQLLDRAGSTVERKGRPAHRRAG